MKLRIQASTFVYMDITCLKEDAAKIIKAAEPFDTNCVEIAPARGERFQTHTSIKLYLAEDKEDDFRRAISVAIQ